EAPEPGDTADADEPKPKKKTRRGSRGGRGRKKTAATTSRSAAGNGAGAAEQIEQPVAKIHGPEREPEEETGEEPTAEEPADGRDGAWKPKKKAGRGTRGGRNRKRKTTATPTAVAADGDGAQTARESDPANEEDWAYVPMSEWADDVLSE